MKIHSILIYGFTLIMMFLTFLVIATNNINNELNELKELNTYIITLKKENLEAKKLVITLNNKLKKIEYEYNELLNYNKLLEDLEK